MALFPFNTNWLREARTDAAAVRTLRLSPVLYNAGSPGTAVTARYVTTASMKVGAYIIANPAPVGGGARNLTVFHTINGGLDTLGTLDIVGTDLADAVLTETITPSNGATVQGLRAFKTVVSVTGVGWVDNGGADTIIVGFGDLIGLPDKLAANTVLVSIFNAVREATAPTVTFSATVLSLNTVDLNSALNASTVTIYYLT